MTPKIALKNFSSARLTCSLVNPGAKQAQEGQAPQIVRELVRPVSVDDALRSHPSLRRRRGLRASATWPLLSGPSLALLTIPARPFGLGLRFGEAPQVAHVQLAPSRAAVVPSAKVSRRYQNLNPCAIGEAV